MKTLIITVGTRHVGWRCRDGIVRSLGADGDRDHPPHIDQLFAEFDQERGVHADDDGKPFPWGSFYLGNIIYQYCQQIQDFDDVKLLMDGVILADQVNNGLSQIILWGTNQPSHVSWNFRRSDTVWLAELMAGKIRSLYPDLGVQVWIPEVAVNQVQQVQQQVQALLVEHTQTLLHRNPGEAQTLQIQSKGSAPQIASSLEICAAALLRQCAVEQLIPADPVPLFQANAAHPGTKEAQFATSFERVSLGQYFWPVERERILSAWKRGDFVEVKVWLESHRDRYECLYKLAQCLVFAGNGEVKAALGQLTGWSQAKTTQAHCSSPATTEILKRWQDLIKQLQDKKPQKPLMCRLVWEEMIFVELALSRENYTVAFREFTQLLERLLFIRCKTERWVDNKWITPPDSYKGSPEAYSPTLGGLLRGWYKAQKYKETNQWRQLLDAVLSLRNDVVHSGIAVNRQKLVSLWEKTGFDTQLELLILMQQALSSVIEHPQETLLFKSLYEWGLQEIQ